MTHPESTSQRTADVERGIGQFTNAWARASGHIANSVVEANRATLAAFGLANGSHAQSDDRTNTEERAEERSESPEADRLEGTDSVAYERDGWVTEETVNAPEEIAVGDSVTFSKRITDEDVRAFAEASGDTNRLHLDDEFAEKTRFGGRIAHGTLVSGLISAALARLPGLTIYLSQDVRFTNPVQIDDRVTATVEVVEDLGKGRYRLSTDVTDGSDERVIEGEAVVLIDSAPDGGE
jgi:acyl dehydratase